MEKGETAVRIKHREKKQQADFSGDRQLTFWQKVKRDRFLLLLLLPGFLSLLIFRYLPMFGVVIAFQDFSPWKGFFDSKWVGMAQFEKLWSSPDFWRIFWNTVILSVQTFLVTFPVPILFALVLNEAKGLFLKKATQTITYLPHFINLVIIAGMVKIFTSPSTGFISQGIGKIMGTAAPYIMADPNSFRPVYVLTMTWVGFGWGTIIYLSALAGVDTQLYEAATIDGAGRLRRIWHITCPALLPTIVITLIMSMGSIINGVSFDLAYLLQNDINTSVSEVLSTFVYKRGIMGVRARPDFSYTTAVNLFQSVIGTVMLVGANFISRRTTERSLW